jgi:hypothetical protein
MLRCVVFLFFAFRCVNHTYKWIQFINHLTLLVLLTRHNNTRVRQFHFSPVLIYITVQNGRTVCESNVPGIVPVLYRSCHFVYPVILFDQCVWGIAFQKKNSEFSRYQSFRRHKGDCRKWYSGRSSRAVLFISEHWRYETKNEILVSLQCLRFLSNNI